VAVKQLIQSYIPELTAWRQDIHAHPETAFEEFRTADIVAEKLQSFGIEVHRGLAGTGVVGSLQVGNSSRAIGLRADMDALDILEENSFGHVSTQAGKMHACGHDGHTVMLLGAARYLAQTRDFDGTVHFIFQPAEENVAGGRVMVEDGLFEQFPVDDVYGMHNSPGIAIGKIAMQVGAAMASADMFEINLNAKGSHGAHPHQGADVIVTAAEVIMALQRIVSRVVNPMQAAVVSVTQVHAGTNMNVIPEKVNIQGTCRSHDPAVRDLIEQRMRSTLEGLCQAHNAEFSFHCDRRYPATINTVKETGHCLHAARTVFGNENVMDDFPPSMGAEDFAWMLQKRPGCYVRLGNGENSKGSCVVHNPNYDFNDDAIVYGASYWATLVEQQLPLQG